MLQEVFGTPELRASPSVSSSAKNKPKYSSEWIQGLPHSHAEKARQSSPSAKRADVGYAKALYNTWLPVGEKRSVTDEKITTK